MGKGDQKTRRGKIFAGSYGKNRKKNSSVIAIPVKVLEDDHALKEKDTPKNMASKTENANIEKPKTTRKKKTEE